ncbi:DUF2789 domain-containing protein [Thalassotalea maritima]|uniref:DUF2789 domain-containing protein n=1 Tax=Thalassotalea maritima TaxID=3242416 RepID=UPI003528C53C
MDLSQHNLSNLFAQLGLDNNQQSMKIFIERHKGIPEHMRLSEAPFWNSSQSRFIEQALEQDSDWSEVVDTFDCMLRSK